MIQATRISTRGRPIPRMLICACGREIGVYNGVGRSRTICDPCKLAERASYPSLAPRYRAGRYAKNPEPQKRRARAYYAANRDAVIARVREHGAANRDEIKLRRYQRDEARARADKRADGRLAHVRHRRRGDLDRESAAALRMVLAGWL